MRLLLALLFAAAVAAAGCGGGKRAASPPATLAAGALPGLASQSRPLGRAALAEDALDPASLSRLLEEAGYVRGSEREFFGRSSTFDHVVARSLRFESADGAERYLGWLGSHARDLLGRVRREPALALGQSGVLVSLRRCGTCKKELPTYLAAWRRGADVLSLLAAGPGVDRLRFAALARRLDARARR